MVSCLLAIGVMLETVENMYLDAGMDLTASFGLELLVNDVTGLPFFKGTAILCITISMCHAHNEGEGAYRCCGKRNHHRRNGRGPFFVFFNEIGKRALPFLFLVKALAELLEDRVGE